MVNSLAKIVILTVFLLNVAAFVTAENYVNWKGGFWFVIPEGWEKVDYRIVDSYLQFMDTSQAVFDYEAVYAPSSSSMFMEDAYLVLTFDSTGQLTKRQSDSMLNTIAGTYATHVYDAPIVKLMSDLVPGKPKIDKAKRAVSVLSDMAFRPGASKKVWQYMQLNDQGLVTFYFYSTDSTFEDNKHIFEKIIESLSFENLREAGGEELKFTDVGGEDIEAPKTEYSDQIKEEQNASEESRRSPGLYFIYAGGLIVLLIVVVRIIRRA